MLYCLGGLTSTEDNFAQKAGAASRAAQYGLALVFPDSSPRNVSLHLTIFQPALLAIELSIEMDGSANMDFIFLLLYHVTSS